MKIALCILLASSIACVGQSAKPVPSATSPTAASPTDPALNEFLVQMQTDARKSDEDVAKLRVDKWKVDSASKQQAEATALSIRRNLANAVPDLVLRIQGAPNSLNANFRLYRNLNVLYDAFSSLVESAGAFGPRDQYDPLAADIAQLDHLRHQLAERIDLLANSSDAELARLRSQLASSSAKPPTKIVVNDDQPQPKPKKKAKPATAQSATQPQPAPQ